MANYIKQTTAALILFVLMQFVFASRVVAATTTVNLGTADSFAVLAGSAVNDANISVIVGDVGLSPSAWLSALTCAEVTGTIYSVDGSGPLPCRVTNPGLLTQAQNDLTTAFTDAGGRTGATVMPGGDNQLGSQVLTDGVYSFSHATSANLTGTLTLNGQGNPDSVFIFQAASDFITASSSVVLLTNGAQACNVFWHVPTSATLGTGSTFVGNILADQSITDNGGSTVDGRFLARIAAVTLDDTSITKSTCSASTGGSSSSSSSSGGSSSSSCPGLPAGVVAPNIVTARRVDADSIFIEWAPYSGISTFIVQYGPTNGNWLYSTNVTGFSTTINNLPANTPFWFRVAARNDCTIGEYGASRLVSGVSTGNPLIPLLPNTGLGPDIKNSIWTTIAGISSSLVIFYLSLRTTRLLSK